jgi:hypothetical protein
MADLFMKSDAIISPCEKYRYTLSRTWDEGLPVVCFVMANPSTADAENPDPTITRCINFSRAWGYGGLVVVNCFAFRATDPKDLLLARKGGVDVVGPENDHHVRVALDGAGCTVAAWGALHKSLSFRVACVHGRLRQLAADRLVCLGLTKAGAPRHPLFVPAKAKLIPF